MDDSKTFGDLVGQALTDAQASQEQSTKGNSTSTGSPEIEHKRLFLRTFRRWEMLFKRKDSDVESDKWLIAEYYKSLGHLSVDGLDRLTDELKARCTFFPTIRECLEVINPPKYSYHNPFYNAPRMFIPGGHPALLPASTRALTYEGASGPR